MNAKRSDCLISRISGTKEGIEKAEHEIRVTSDQQSKKASERLNIPKMYHPFIAGAFNENVNQLAAETGARINIPPPSVMKGILAALKSPTVLSE